VFEVSLEHRFFIPLLLIIHRMRIILIIVAVMLLLAGAVWILQGVNILPGSFMTGQIRWAYAGAVAVLFGGGLLWLALRRR
jgi:hypothetical protein